MKLILLALVVAACGSKDAPAPKSEPAPRSGKIDLPSAPGGAGSSGMRDGRIPDMRRDRSADDNSLRGDRPRGDRNRGAQDTDGDGVISADERAEAVEKRMAEMKARADKNGDGTVSEEEIAAGRRDRAENMLGRLDKDGDGKLTVAEIGETRMRRFDAAAADTNKDGTITIEELETAMQASGPGPWGRRRDRLNGGSGSAAP